MQTQDCQLSHQGLPGAVLLKGARAELPQSSVLGRIGSLEVRLARDEPEILAAQKLRYEVFFEELGATGQSAAERIDADGFDGACDHLIVVDNAIAGPESGRIVGTYRLLRQTQAAARGGFYSEGEYELAKLTRQHPAMSFLELGRSCVQPAYRTKRTIELLWQGIWGYITAHRIDVMVGCASFAGTVPAAHAEALTYLHHHCRAVEPWAVEAVAGRHHSMDLMPIEAVNMRSALFALPPLIKGYLRLGAKIGDGCVIDRDFKTVDVFIVLPVKDIGERYIQYYSGESQKLVA